MRCTPLTSRISSRQLRLLSEYIECPKRGIIWADLYLAARHPIFKLGKLDSLLLERDNPYHWMRVSCWEANKRGAQHLEETRQNFPEILQMLAMAREREAKGMEAEARRRAEEQRRSAQIWIDALRPEVLHGRRLSKSDQVRLCGNSVCPPIAAALVRANCAELAEQVITTRASLELGVAE